MPPQPPRLASLGGDPAPPEMAADLALLAGLSHEIRCHLWEALGFALMEPMRPDLEERLDRFCREHEVDDAELARVLKACRHLVRAAAALDLPRDAFLADLALLVPEDDVTKIQAALVNGYDAGKQLVRLQLARQILAEHDDLVTAVTHREERIVASSHGAGFDIPILALTFQIRRDGRDEQVTVRLPRAQVEALRRKLPPA